MQSLIDITAECLVKHLERIDFWRLPKDLHLPLLNKVNDKEYTIKELYNGPTWLETEYWSNKLWKMNRYGRYKDNELIDEFGRFYRLFSSITKHKLISLTVHSALVVENIDRSVVEDIKLVEKLIVKLEKYKERYPKYASTATQLLDNLIPKTKSMRPEWIEEHFWSEEWARKYLKKYNSMDEFSPSMNELIEMTQTMDKKETSKVYTIIFMMHLINSWILKQYPTHKKIVLNKLKEFASNKYYGEMAQKFMKRL